MISNFHKQKDQELAEGIALEIVKNFNYDEIKDVSQDKEYQAIDVDIVAFEDQEEVRFEVKNDEMIDKTGNIFAEYLQVYPTYEVSGWLYATKADYIFYRASNLNLALLFITDDLRDYVEKHSPKNKIINDFKEKNGKSRLVKNQWGKLVNVKDFISKYEVQVYNDEAEQVGISIFLEALKK